MTAEFRTFAAAYRRAEEELGRRSTHVFPESADIVRIETYLDIVYEPASISI